MMADVVIRQGGLCPQCGGEMSPESARDGRRKRCERCSPPARIQRAQRMEAKVQRLEEVIRCPDCDGYFAAIYWPMQAGGKRCRTCGECKWRAREARRERGFVNRLLSKTPSRRVAEHQRHNRIRYEAKHGVGSYVALVAVREDRSSACQLEDPEHEARQAWRWWIREGAPDEWVAAYWAALGKPWLNRRLSDVERYRMKWECKPGFQEQERRRSRDYKYKNPDKTAAYGDRRKRRVARQSDGTIDGDVMHAIVAERSRCPYCNVALASNNLTIDHMDPVAHGGLHSACNLIACCKPCNRRKRAKPFHAWLLELRPRLRRQAEAMYRKKQGRSPMQMGLSLVA